MGTEKGMAAFSVLAARIALRKFSEVAEPICLAWLVNDSCLSLPSLFWKMQTTLGISIESLPPEILLEIIKYVSSVSSVYVKTSKN